MIKFEQEVNINGFVQDCSISIAIALGIPQSSTKPMMYLCDIYFSEGILPELCFRVLLFIIQSKTFL